MGTVGGKRDGEDRRQRRQRTVDQTSHRGLHALKQERLLNALSGWASQVCRGHVDPSSVMNGTS
jgi:hypothetical protein